VKASEHLEHISGTILAIFTGSIAQVQSAGIEVTQRPILSFFTPQGRHVAPMKVKFGTWRGPKVSSSVPNFTTIGATVGV